MTIYAKLDSWHEVELSDDQDAPAAGDSMTYARALTRCGLEVPGGAPTSPTLPLEEKSCESCLRLARHDAEQLEADTDQVPG